MPMEPKSTGIMAEMSRWCAASLYVNCNAEIGVRHERTQSILCRVRIKHHHLRRNAQTIKKAMYIECACCRMVFSKFGWSAPRTPSQPFSAFRCCCRSIGEANRMFGKLKMSQCTKEWNWTRDEIFRSTSSKTTKLLSKKERRRRRKKARILWQWKRCSIHFNDTAFPFFLLPSSHSCFTFTFFPHETRLPNFLRFLLCDVLFHFHFMFFFYCSSFLDEIELATQSGYTRKHLDAFFASRRWSWRRRWRRKTVMDVWWRDERRENIQKKVKKKCEVNVRDIVFNALVHLDYHYADCVYMLDVSCFAWHCTGVLVGSHCDGWLKWLHEFVHEIGGRGQRTQNSLHCFRMKMEKWESRAR